MSNIKISEMTEATSLGDSDLLTIVQGGVNKKITKTNALGNIITALNNPTYVTGSGTSPSLSNTRVGEMSILPKGNTEQTSYSGKNLFNPTLATDTTINHVTFTKVYNSDGTLAYINANGTASDLVMYDLTNSTTLQAGTYKISGCPSGGGTTTFDWRLDATGTVTDKGSGYTLTIGEETTYINSRIIIRSGYVANNLQFKPMIESGSSATTYEPYVGRNSKPQSFIPSRNTNSYWRKYNNDLWGKFI